MRERWVGGLLLATGGMLFLFAAFSANWWTYRASGQRLGFGLLETADARESISYSTLLETRAAIVVDGRLSETFMTVGRVCFVLCLFAFVAIASTVISMVLGRSRYQWAYLVVILAAAFAIGFLKSAPDAISTHSFGAGFYVFWLGVAATIAGDVLQGNSMGLPAGPTQVDERARIVSPCPACTTCRAPTNWVAEHHRFYCPRCNLYV